MNIIDYADREMLAMHVADLLAGELQSCLLTHETASFAVPGGSSPGPIFDILSGIHFEWDRVHVMLTDERWVPQDDPRSNTALVRQRLLTGRAAQARFVPYYVDGVTAAQGAEMSAPAVAPELPLSLVLLGMGEDMHTASLFPGARGLQRAMAHDAPLLCPISAEGQDIDRVTLPAHVLNGAMSRHLVIFGEAKREALARAVSLDAEDAPIVRVLGGGTVHWAA